MPRSDIIGDPPRGSVKVVPAVKSGIPDKVLRSELLRAKRDTALRRIRYIYDRAGDPLGTVTFEVRGFDPLTGKPRKT